MRCTSIQQSTSEGLIASSTSHIEKKSISTTKEDAPASPSKNTLADQVAMGKYGLIQKELFSTPSPRPGVLSYAANEEVPKDMEVLLLFIYYIHY